MHHTSVLKVCSIHVTGSAPAAWIITQDNGVLVVRKMPMDADLLSISQDGMVLDGDVKLSSDLFVNSVHLPADADYANAATGSLVPKSYMPSRQHAFTQGLDHALVTDTEKDANYYNNTQPDALWYYATSKWGPYTISQTEYTRRSRVFTAVVPWAETQTPAFRYASFGSPPSGQSVAVINAFPHAQSTLIYSFTLFLRGLQIGSGGGGNLISVKVRVHDTAVGTGLYDDEVVREVDLASNEAVSVNGSFADGWWSWKKSLTWVGVGRITMNAGSAYRVSLKITLSSPVAQADTNTYATVHLRNLSATFNAQTFSGSVPAPTATATTITVTHSLSMSGGNNWAILCRVYSASKASATAAEIYTRSGVAASQLVASAAFARNSNGALLSTPLVFSGLTPSATYHVYVVAKGSSGAYSQAYEHVVVMSTPPSLTLTAAASYLASSPAVTATFSKTVTGFAIGDVSVTNGTVDTVTGSGTTYTIALKDITPYSPTTVSVGAGAAADSLGDGNTAANPVTFTYAPPPAVTLSTTSLTPRTPDPVARPVTATFTRPVTGFVVGDVAVTNASVSDFVAVDAATYTFNVTPTMADNATTVNVGADVATDTLTGFGNTAAATLSFTYSYDPSLDTALYAWYDPSDGTTLFSNTAGTAVQSTAGGNVLRMNDKKNLASGYYVSQSNSAKTPTLDTTELNGKTSLRFINSRSGLLTSSSTFWGSIGTQSCMVIVAKQLTSATYPDTNSPGSTDVTRGYMIGSTASRSNRFVYQVASQLVIAATTGPGSTQIYVTMASRPGLFDNTQHVLALSIDTVLNTFTTGFDGRTAAAAGGSDPVTFTGNLAVGGDTTNVVRAFDGWIGEILIYNTAKTSAELELIRGYLVNKWGTPQTVRLTVGLTTSTATPTTSPVSVTATFSESVADFASGDVAVTNGSVTAFSGSGTTYTITVTPTTPFTPTTVDVAANAAQTASGKLNIVANQLTFTYTPPRPTVTLTTASSTPTGNPVQVTATFSAAVTGFELGDIALTNATASNLAGPFLSNDYTFDVTALTAYQATTVAVGANAAYDTALGAAVGNTASSTLSFTYSPPTATLATTAGSTPTTSPVDVTATFSTSVTGFALGDITVTNGTAANLTGSGASYAFQVTPTTAYSSTSVSVGAGTVVDASGNANVASNTLSFTYAPQPTVTLSTSAGSTSAWSFISATATFSRAVTGFALGDITVTNGTASNLVGSGASYTFNVTATTANSATSFSVGAGAVTDAVFGTGNSASNSLSFTYTPYNPATDSSLYAWYDPTDSSTLYSDTNFTTLATTSVRGMKDKKGTQHLLCFTTNAPTIDNTSLNSKRSLQFSYSLRNGLQSNGFFWGRPQNTLIVVAKSNTPSVYPRLSGSSSKGLVVGAQSNYGLGICNNCDDYKFYAILGTDGATQPICTNAEFYDGQAHVLALSCDLGSTPKTSITRFDGRDGGAYTGTAVQNPGRICVGADIDWSTRNWDGWTGEILIYSTAKTAAELEAIRAYLSEKWGTPATPPA